MKPETTIPTDSDTGNPLCTRVECLAPCAGCLEDPDGGFLNCKRFDVARHLADNNEGDPVQVPRRRYQRLLATQLSDPGNPAVTAEPAPVPNDGPSMHDPLIDGYQEILDFAVYQRQAIIERAALLAERDEWKRRAQDAERRVATREALVQTLTDELAEHEGSMYDEPAPAGCVD